MNFVEMYRQVGREVAALAQLEDLTVQQIIELEKRTDFQEIYDSRHEFYKLGNIDEVAMHYNDSRLVRNVRIKNRRGESHLVQWKLNKSAGRIDFLDFDGTELNELLDLLYLHPEINCETVKFLTERSYSFEEEKNGYETIYFFKKNDGKRDFFLRTSQETITHIGNQNRILLSLLVEFAMWWGDPLYYWKLPSTPEEKAMYEVDLMARYYEIVPW